MVRRATVVLVAMAGVVRVGAVCTTNQGVQLTGPAAAPPATAGSAGECCDACIQTANCAWWSYVGSKCSTFTSVTGVSNLSIAWSGWAGTGPTPPQPQPGPASGQWSAPHIETSCESSAPLQQVGLVSLAACQAACVANPKCNFADHADQSDHRCTLYAECPTPVCRGGNPGWWTTYQYGRSGLPWMGCSTPTPPPPPSPAPSDPAGFDCQVRLFALEFAKNILQGANVSSVLAGLGLKDPTAAACLAALPSGLVDGPSLAEAHRRRRRPAPAAATALYIDPVKGSDSNAGSLASPFKTIQKGQAAVRAAKAAGATPITVYLRGGTYFVGETLTFGPADGGAGGGESVTWTAYESETPVLSGGVDLTGLTWTPPAGGASTAWTTSLPAPARGIQTLFVGGTREIRAKFPNGDPLIPGGAGWAAQAAGAYGQYSATGEQFPDTVKVMSTAGNLLSTGADMDGTMKTFTVSEPLYSYNPTRQDFYAYENHSAERFNLEYNHPFWNSQTSAGFSTNALTKSWANASTAIVQMYHTGGWGGWSFQVADRPSADTLVFSCRKLADGSVGPCPESDPNGEYVIDGGYQECRGAAIGKNNFYVENVAEELDDTREWFAASSGELRYIPSNTTNLADKTTPVVGAVLDRIIEVNGAAHLTFSGITFSHTIPTYLHDYECPSGGDWAIHRGAALFVQDSTNVSLQGLTFDQVSGNAVMFSNAVNQSEIVGCSFSRVGESAIAMLGSTRLMDGTPGNGLYPEGNLIQSNIVDTVGVYGKQTSAYFKGKSAANIVKGNVFMNGPRAGVNFNDGTKGGEVLEQNLIMNFVRESGDHGMFNSWDRQPIVHHDDAGAVAINPATHQIRNNFIFNRNWLGTTKSGYSIDWDDGSSMYNATSNFLVYGGFKVRDGINRGMLNNLIWGKPADYQVAGFNSTSFVGNTVIDPTGIHFGCVGTAFGPIGGTQSVHQHHNTYYTPNGSATFNACGDAFADLQKAGYEVGSTLNVNITVNAIIDKARTLLLSPES